MEMKLLTNVLRISHAAADEAATRPIDPRRRVFRELVVRRDGFAPWGLSAPAPRAAKPPREPAREVVWADTQPGWRE